MKLADLHPQWILRGASLRIVGIRFSCPINDGAGPHHDGHSVCVLFANPPDGGLPHPDDPDCPGNNGGQRWHRTGPAYGDIESLASDLTLSPSVDCTASTGCDKTDHAQCSHTHCWHGYVQNGNVT